MSEKVKRKCQVAGCEEKAVKRNQLSRLRYCLKHSRMRHNYVFRKKRVPFRYERLEAI